MRILTVIRHGKAGNQGAGMSDFDRPLTARGARDARRMAASLKARLAPPDLFVISPSARTTATCRLIAAAFGTPDEAVRAEVELYLAPLDVVFQVLRRLPPDVSHAVLVGHNPGLAELVDTLLPEPLGRLPTCGVVSLALALDHWSGLRPRPALTAAPLVLSPREAE